MFAIMVEGEESSWLRMAIWPAVLAGYRPLLIDSPGSMYVSNGVLKATGMHLSQFPRADMCSTQNEAG